MVFDRHNGAFLSPVNGVRQAVADFGLVAIALRTGNPPAGVGFGAEISLPVLVVGEIGEAVRAKPVAPVGQRVLLVDVAQVVLEYLEPLLGLPQRVVGFSVLHHPLRVHRPYLVVGPQAGDAVLLVVGHDGHVGSPSACGEDGERNEQNEEREGPS